MPATYTHHTFTKDIYRNLKSSIQEKIDINTFCLFGKSFDVLFFINGELGHYAHNHKVNLYFKNIIQYIKNNHLENNAEVLSYLYGSICHYILDSTCHPYIFYHTGVYRMSKDTKKYRGMHSYYEYMIDAIYFQERMNKPIYKASLRNEVLPKLIFTEELNQALDYVYNKTFQIENGSELIKKGYRNYRFLFKYGMTAKLGIKRNIYKILDLFYKKGRLTYLNYHIKKLDMSVLNLNHEKWCHPLDKNMTYHYSFYDLYDIALENAKEIITSLHEALLKDDESVNEVLEKLGDNKYSTGLPCSNHKGMQYFKY